MLFNFQITDTVTGEETAWGTFKANLDKYEANYRAKNIAYAYFFNHDVCARIYTCDETSGGFESLELLAEYTTHEN